MSVMPCIRMRRSTALLHSSPSRVAQMGGGLPGSWDTWELNDSSAIASANASELLSVSDTVYQNSVSPPEPPVAPPRAFVGPSPTLKESTGTSFLFSYDQQKDGTVNLLTYSLLSCTVLYPYCSRRSFLYSPLYSMYMHTILYCTCTSTCIVLAAAPASHGTSGISTSSSASASVWDEPQAMVAPSYSSHSSTAAASTATARAPPPLPTSTRILTTFQKVEALPLPLPSRLTTSFCARVSLKRHTRTRTRTCSA